MRIADMEIGHRYTVMARTPDRMTTTAHTGEYRGEGHWSSPAEDQRAEFLVLRIPDSEVLDVIPTHRVEGVEEA